MVSTPSNLSRKLDIFYNIAKLLDENGVEYQLSGSLAGKFYGLAREPGDIDIDMPLKYRPVIERLFCENIKRPFYRNECDFYDSEQIVCDIGGEKVEFVFMDNSFLLSHLTGLAMPAKQFWKPILIPFRDIKVSIQDITQLFGYKFHNLNQEFAKNQVADACELKEIFESGSWRDFRIE